MGLEQEGGETIDDICSALPVRGREPVSVRWGQGVLRARKQEVRRVSRRVPKGPEGQFYRSPPPAELAVAIVCVVLCVCAHVYQCGRHAWTAASDLCFSTVRTRPMVTMSVVGCKTFIW